MAKHIGTELAAPARHSGAMSMHEPRDGERAFGCWLKRCRQILGLTQSELARRLGYSVVTYRKVEQGERASLAFAERLANLLAISTQERAAFLYFVQTGKHTHPAALLPQPQIIDRQVAPNPQPSLAPTTVHKLHSPALPLVEGWHPPRVVDFIGRESELRAFAEQLATSHLVVIHGMTGVGKTALAAVLARQVRPLADIFWHVFHAGQGIDAIIWEMAAFLAWHGQPNLWDVLKHIQQGSEQIPPPNVLLDYVIHLLEDRGYLVCLDDFHFVESDPLVEHFILRLQGLVAVGSVSLIIIAQRLPSFVHSSAFPPLAGLSVEDVHALLQRYGILLTSAQLVDLHVRTEGNAQLVNLARMAMQHTPDLARTMTHLLDSSDVEHFLMRKVDQQLTDEEREVMGIIAALLGFPASREAIEFVWDRNSVQPILSRLRRYSLLFGHEGEQGLEYAQHAMVQSFYYRRLGRYERCRFHSRAATYYTTEQFDALRAARHLLAASEYTQAAQVVTEHTWTIINRGQARALRGILDQCASQPLAVEQRIAVQIARAEVDTLLGDLQAARASYEEALKQTERLPDSMITQGNLARICRGMGELLEYDSPQEALAWLRRGMEQAQDSCNLLERGILQLRISSVLITMGEYDAALDAMRASLELLPQEPNQWRARVVMNQGIVWCSKGDFVRGQQCFLDALALYEQLHDDWGRVAIRQNLGRVKDVLGDWEGAAAEYQQAIILAERLGVIARQAELQLNLGILRMNQGRMEEARACFAWSLELASGHGLRMHIIPTQTTIADLYIRLGDWAAAADTLREIEQSPDMLKDQLPEIYRNWAQVHLALAAPDAALQDAQRAVALASELGDPIAEGMGLRVLAEIQASMGQTEMAMETLRRSLSMLEDQEPYEAARTQLVWGRLLIADGDYLQGTALIGTARDVFKRLGAQRELALATSLLGQSGAREG